MRRRRWQLPRVPVGGFPVGRDVLIARGTRPSRVDVARSVSEKSIPFVAGRVTTYMRLAVLVRCSVRSTERPRGYERMMQDWQRVALLLCLLCLLGACSTSTSSLPVLETAEAVTACEAVIPDTAQRMDGRLWEDVFRVPGSQTIVYLGSNLALEGRNGALQKRSYSCFFDSESLQAEFSTTKVVVLVLEKAHKALGVQTNMSAGKYQILGTTEEGWLHASYRNEHIPGGGKPGLFGVPSTKRTAAVALLGGIGGLTGEAAASGEKPRIAFRPDQGKVCAKPGRAWLCKSKKSVPFRFEILDLGFL